MTCGSFSNTIYIFVDDLFSMLSRLLEKLHEYLKRLLFLNFGRCKTGLWHMVWILDWHTPHGLVHSLLGGISTLVLNFANFLWVFFSVQTFVLRLFHVNVMLFNVDYWSVACLPTIDGPEKRNKRKKIVKRNLWNS